MLIKRLQVDEGFLDGLDLQFSHGLNVLIGARGTGKTSIVELVRYALGVESMLPEAAERSREHALGVLGPGRIVLTLEDGKEETIVVRSASDEVSIDDLSDNKKPLIFSQTEVEAIALNPAGRLKLIDGFLEDEFNALLEEGEVVAVLSLTKEISSRGLIIEDYESELVKLPAIKAELATLVADKDEFAKASGDVAAKNEKLQQSSRNLSILAVAADDNDRVFKVINQQISSVVVTIENWAETPAPTINSKILHEVLVRTNSASKKLAEVLAELRLAADMCRENAAKLSARRSAEEQVARELRQEVEQMSEGAGKRAAQIQELQKRVAQIESLQGLLKTQKAAVKELSRRRAAALERLEKERDAMFQRRKAIAASLNERLGPRIKVVIERAGQIEPYAVVITNALRGSGIQYNTLARSIAESVSPRELVEWTESSDYSSLAAAVSITEDRAARCLSALQEANLESLITFRIEDRADFFLLDQSTHKPINTLSVGQRCTVVLPIILERRNRVLIIDQPEDHIDNAFIADTLIKAIVDRSASDQVIMPTHNANIPVLGDADLVTHMGSDGKRGFVLSSGALEEPDVVSAITTVMEGGRQAFERRANFYHEHA